MALSLGLLQMPSPTYHHADDPGSGSILLDPYGHLSSRTNGTTAQGFTRDGRTILVTFWVSSPPRVSSFSIHCDDLRPSVRGTLPMALSSHDDLVLFRFPITVGHRDDDDQQHFRVEDDHYFVYQAGSKPSLHLVPLPHRLLDLTLDGEAVLLRRRDQDMFYLAVLTRVSNFNYRDKQYDVHLYSSKTATWNTKLTSIDYSPKEDFKFGNPDSVLTIGGESGSVAWVDLSGGILICDLLLLHKHSRLRYVPLPLPPLPRPLRGDPPYSRTVILLGDHIKLFEMVRVRPTGSNTRCTTCGATPTQPQALVAATNKMKISDIGSSGNNSWEEDSSLSFSEIPVDSLKFGQLLPSLKQVADRKLTLESLHVGYPALSTQDADVVYIVQTPGPNKDKESAIAVDMRTKTIKDVACFRPGRYLRYNYACLQSGISS